MFKNLFVSFDIYQILRMWYFKKLLFYLDVDCIGTYTLSRKKGAWSIYCEKRDVNASGILKWDDQTGAVSGNGKDS